MSAAPRASRATGGLRAWLELARISNSPTIVSNALAGASLAVLGADGPAAVDPAALVAATAGLLAIYAAGMILNDAADAPVDRIERPGRPVPSGRIRRRSAWIAGSILLVGGGASSAAVQRSQTGWLAVACLVGCVGIYTAVHLRTRFSIAALAACRGLVYAIAFGSIADPGAERAWLAPATGVALYTAAISAIARSEAGGSAPTMLLRLVPLLLSAAVVAAADGEWGIGTGAALALMVVWHLHAAIRLSRGARVPDAVQRWIAGFCLIDAGVCTVAGRGDLALACAGCFVLTRWWQRSIVGT